MNPLIPVFCLASLAAGFAAAGVPLAEATAPYSVPEMPWKLELGHHRACVTVDQAAPVVRAHLPWRVQFEGMQNRRILVLSAADGKEVANVVRASADRMAGDILFEAASAGDYHIY